MKRFAFAFAFGVVACAGAPSAPPAASGPAPAASTEARSANQQPPPSVIARRYVFPFATRATLENGLEVVTTEAPALPFVHVRVVVRAGTADAPSGVAHLASRVLGKSGTTKLPGARFAERLDNLGGTVGVDVTADATTLSLSVPRESLPGALDALADLAAAPHLDAADLAKARAAIAEEAGAQLKDSGLPVVTRAALRELLGAESAYAKVPETAHEAAAVTLDQVRLFHHKFFAPDGMVVLVVGDVTPDAMLTAARGSFGRLKGHRIASTEPLVPPPPPPSQPRVVIAHGPNSKQSDVVLASLGPARASAQWPALQVALHWFDASSSTRAPSEDGAALPPPFSLNASLVELARGPTPVLAHTSAPAGATAAAVEALIVRTREHGPTPAGTARAVDYVIGEHYSVNCETADAITDLVARQSALGLPDRYWDRYAEDLRLVTAPTMRTVAEQVLAAPPRIVVAGDADVVAPLLTRYGDVTVLDPDKGFAVVRTLPATRVVRETLR